MRVAIFDIKVFIRAVAMKKRCAYTHLHDVLPKTFKKINSTGHSCIFAERDQSIIFVICFFS